MRGSSGIAAGTSLANEIHTQPSFALPILQYHMTEGSGSTQQDSNFALALTAQPDVNPATGAGGMPLLSQIG